MAERFHKLFIVALSQLALAKAGTLREKFPEFYNWAYPREFSPVTYSQVFNDNLEVKRYDFSSLSDLRQALRDADHHLLRAKGNSVTFGHDPIDSSFGWSILYEPDKFVLESSKLEKMINTMIDANNTLDFKEKIILRRDVWRILADIKTHKKLTFSNQEHQRKFVEDVERELSRAYSSMSQDREWEAALKAVPSLEDIINAVNNLESRSYLAAHLNRGFFRQVRFNPLWEHNIAFGASSLFGIWISDDLEGNRMAILARYSISPLKTDQLLMYPTALIEEIFISGVGDSPPFAKETGDLLWRAHFALDREVFVNSPLREGSDRSWKSYLNQRDMDKPAFIGFSSDAINLTRGGKTILTERTSCIECHSDVFEKREFALQHDKKYSLASDRLFDLIYDFDKNRVQYSLRKLSIEN